MLIQTITRPLKCVACNLPFAKQKTYFRRNLALCHACLNATTSAERIMYALARFRIREAGFTPFSFSELAIHDRILQKTSYALQTNFSDPATSNLTTSQVKHIINFIKHHTVTRYPAPPSSAAFPLTITITLYALTAMSAPSVS